MNGRAKAAVPALLVLFTACAGTGGGPGGPPAEPPNIVFLLVDDLGAMDVGAFNPDTFYETPNIDRLAAGGVRFTRGYAANPVCSPTRYSIMTGRYPTPGGRDELPSAAAARSRSRRRRSMTGWRSRSTPSPRRSATAATAPRSWASGTWGRRRSSGRSRRAST